ncbi:hypothetical protein, partial [Endozoicomonas sp. ONNA2]|uniref:hypothetical protein n=1 Tax=Endozoicomonas sp. ONNA2 TaxID=2828741 RepID=UPI0021488488
VPAQVARNIRFHMASYLYQFHLVNMKCTGCNEWLLFAQHLPASLSISFIFPASASFLLHRYQRIFCQLIVN